MTLAIPWKFTSPSGRDAARKKALVRKWSSLPAVVRSNCSSSGLVVCLIPLFVDNTHAYVQFTVSREELGALPVGDVDEECETDTKSQRYTGKDRDAGKDLARFAQRCFSII